MIYAALAYLTYPVVWLLSRLRKVEHGSVIVFQTAKIGDLICTTPVFREIKKARPGARLGVVVDPVTRPLLEQNPHVDEIIEFSRKYKRGLSGKLGFGLMLSKKRYSIALVLMPDTANILASFWAVIPERIFIMPDRAGRTLRALMPLATSVERHERGRSSMETFLASLKYMGIKEWSIDKEVYSSPGSEKKAEEALRGHGSPVGLVLGTGNPLKDWGEEKFLELARRILDGTASSVVLLGGSVDSGRAEKMLEKIKAGDRLKNFCGRFGLDELPELIKRFSIVVGVDTGLIYMADALGVPLINIAGPSDMEDQRPTGGKCVIIQKRELFCVPCSHTFHTPYECREGHRRCVEDVTVDEVFEALSPIISQAMKGFS